MNRKNAEHMKHKQHEGDFLVSYDTYRQNRKMEEPLDINNTTIEISMSNNIPP